MQWREKFEKTGGQIAGSIKVSRYRIYGHPTVRECGRCNHQTRFAAGRSHQFALAPAINAQRA
jgi:hypothetical protein